MRKLRKLLTTPGLFFRDFLINRYPIDFGNNVGKPTEARALLDVLELNFPIDFVYTWVDHSDRAWAASKDAHAREHDLQVREDTTSLARYESHDELRYSLRALEAYAPWVRHVYLVTAGHVPSWLKRDHPRLRLVKHEDIIPGEFLPTFNSHVIEAHLHHIPGLAEHYVYFNDDVMLTKPMQPSDFFLSSGAALMSTSGKVIPSGAPHPGDTPMDCASKNVRSLLRGAYGVEISKQILHGYHVQRKATALRCDALVREHWQPFAGNRFRAMSDLNVATLLHHYVGYLEGLTVFARASCMYLNVHSPAAAFGYRASLDLKGKPAAPDALCVNQVWMDLSTEQREAHDRALASFLERYYPQASSFEQLDAL
jgi:hypothetical protein